MSILSVSVTAWIPIRRPMWAERAEAEYAAREELIRALPSLLPQLPYKIAVKSVNLLDQAPAEIRSRLSTSNFLISADLVDYVRVDATSDLDPEAFAADNEGRELTDDVAEMFASLNLAMGLETVFVLSDLALPGCLDVHEGVCVGARELGGHFVRAKGSFFQLAFPEDNDPTWPHLKTTTLDEVVSWASETSFARSAIAESRIERTLAAYTHVVGLSLQNEGEVLFRAMQGLEAFYCDGHGDLRKQISEKSVLWLGPWPDKKNIVGHLYDLRSKFVHGAARMDYWPNDGRAWDEDEKLMKELSFGVVFALRLLVATLQRCVKERVVDVTWNYGVVISAVGA